MAPLARPPKSKSNSAPWSDGPASTKFPVEPMSDGPASASELANPSLLVNTISVAVPVSMVEYSENAVGSMSQSMTRRYRSWTGSGPTFLTSTATS